MTERSQRESTNVRLGLGALLLLVVTLAYWGSLWGQFIYDDTRLVAVNPNVASLGAALRAFFEPLWNFDAEAGFQSAFWRPLTLMTLALGRRLSGLDPLGFHLLSLALHGLATLAAWRLATRLLGSRTLGFGAALIFGLHPVHVESVAWISAVNDPLFGLFAILSLDAFLAWRQAGSRGVPIAAGAWLLGALLCKEQALAVVPIAVAIDLGLGHLGPLGRGRHDGGAEGRGSAEAGDPSAGPPHGSSDPFADLLRAYGPLLAVAVLYYGARVYVYGDLGAGFDRSLAHFGLTFWREQQFRVEIFGRFLELLTVPFDQEVFRQVRPQLPEGHGPWLRALVFSLAWVGGVAWAAWRRRRLALAMLLALPAAFSPIILSYESAGAFPISDRYLYLPVIFAAVLAAAAASRLRRREAVLGVLALAAVLGGVRTDRYSANFHDEETFFRAAVEASPDNAYVRWGMGRVLLEKYQRSLEMDVLEESSYHYLVSRRLGMDYGDRQPRLGPEASFGERANELNTIINEAVPANLRPDPTVMVSKDDRLQANIGHAWCMLFLALATDDRDLELPAALFEGVLRVEEWSENPQAHTGLGTVYLQMGRLEAAEASLRRAVAADPTYSEAWHNLGLCLARRGQWDDARNSFEEALRFRPGHLDDLIQAAKAAIEAGRFEIALGHLAEASRRYPRSPSPIYWRGMLDAVRGDPGAALERFDRVLAILPDHPQAHLQKGKVLIQLGEVERAARALGRACELMPESFEAYYHMVGLLMTTDEGAVLPYLERAYALSPPDQRRQTLHVALAGLVANDPRRTRDLAQLAEQRGDLVHALHWTELALDRLQADPQTSPETFAALEYKRGYYMWNLGRPEEATEAYAHCLRLVPDHFFAHHDMALIEAYERKRPSEAQAHAKKALELFPGARDLIDADMRGAIRAKLESIVKTSEPQMGPVLPPDGDGKPR